MVRYLKVYVAVTLHVGTDGRTKPVALEWEDGKIFYIDKVFSERNSPPEHVGALLTRRYDVLICGREKSLYLETTTNRWFVEKPLYG